MSTADDRDLPEEQSRAIAARVREELARRRLSREQLAHDARISLSTLEKALSGRRPFTLATTVRLEEALHTPLRPSRAAAPSESEVAPDALGAYSHASVAWLEGEYLTLRPSFERKGSVYAYRTVIAWDRAAASLVFREADRLDPPFAQTGVVSLPSQSGHVYLVTNHHGQYRLVVLGRPTINGDLHGLVTTLRTVGSQMFPVSAPVADALLAGVEGEPALGVIPPDHPAHAGYRQRLERTLSESYARFFNELD